MMQQAISHIDFGSATAAALWGNYISARQPVVLTDCLDGSDFIRLRSWTDDYLRNKVVRCAGSTTCWTQRALTLGHRSQRYVESI